MNGAENLLRTLVHNNVEVCFANPGTSEMHFVAALDRVDGMRCVLGLFEGVVTGAADGYARMARRPAATLLHLGPGLANGLSNIHNAKRGRSPMINVIGDHATYHRRYDTPLTSDIEGVARPFNDWVRTTPNSNSVAADAADAVAAARRLPGQIASLILPADAAWTPVTDRPGIVPTAGEPERPVPDGSAIDAAERILRTGNRAALLLGANATLEEPLELAGRVAAATGCRILAETMLARTSRGAGRTPVEPIPYPVEAAVQALHNVEDLILVGATTPVGFFAYPDKPSVLVNPGTRVYELARPDHDVTAALELLADACGPAATNRAVMPLDLPARPTGDITREKIAALVAAVIPENAVVVDESITSGAAIPAMSATSHPHEWLGTTGGSIGFAMPVGVGAAIASPGRKVIVLESDGSGMYQPQALWTCAREKLDVLVIVFANAKYQILQLEMYNVGVDKIGDKARALLDIDRPTIDWVALARSMGVEAHRAETMDDLSRLVDAALVDPGPNLIEVPIR